MFVIPLQKRRKLHENLRDFVLMKACRALHVVVDELVHALRQRLAVRDEAAQFERIDEMRRNCRTPALDLFRFWQTVCRGIQFDGIEALGVIVEPFPLRKAFRIKPPAPIGVDPAAGADANQRLGRNLRLTDLFPDRARQQVANLVEQRCDFLAMASGHRGGGRIAVCARIRFEHRRPVKGWLTVWRA